jgi:NAD(P)H dehydrogenase (quinone)
VTLDITGPAGITQAELAQITSAVTGRPVAYVPVPAEAIVAGMVAAGLPQPVAEVYVTFGIGAADGTLGVASSAVSDLTGKAPQSVHDFLAAHREALLA